MPLSAWPASSRRIKKAPEPVVRGTIYIDTFNGTVQTGDEVVALPYAYTVVK
jgi:hypothetical protein